MHIPTQRYIIENKNIHLKMKRRDNAVSTVMWICECIYVWMDVYKYMCVCLKIWMYKYSYLCWSFAYVEKYFLSHTESSFSSDHVGLATPCTVEHVLLSLWSPGRLGPLVLVHPQLSIKRIMLLSTSMGKSHKLNHRASRSSHHSRTKDQTACFPS